MKKTLYLTSSIVSQVNYQLAINETIKKRDEFLANNDVQEISNEHLSFQLFPSHSSGSPNSLFAIITLSYYTKTEDNKNE